MRLFVMAALALTLVTGPANAQSRFVSPQCRAYLPESAPFDDRQHLLWYNRFWTGQCVSGLSWCLSGSPHWSGSITSLAAQAPGARREEAVQRLCALGHLVGLEWAKDNAIRRIDTNALRRFEATLRTGQGDIFARLTSVEAQARRMLERPR